MMRFVKWLVVLIYIIILFGCGEKTEPARQAIQMQQPTPSPKVKQAPAYKKAVQPYEYDGFVYRGLLHKELRDSGFGWSLQDVAKTFEIPFLETAKPKEYKDFVVPYKIRVGNKKEAVTFQLDTSHKEALKYLKSAEGADASYIVMKNGRQVEMKSPPFAHHGSAINIQPMELLQLLHINYVQEGQTFYIGQEAKSPIEGKVLFDHKMMITNKKETDVKLIYHYNQASKPNYEKVDLIIDGESVILFDNNRKGSSDYYENGLVEAVSFNGNTLLKVNLDEDIVILKRTGDRWERVFSPDQYRSFRQDNLSLMIAPDGTGTFIDHIHQLEHKVSVTGGSPNTSYQIGFMFFESFEMDEAQKELAISADLSAQDKGRSIFNMKIRFIYDGTTFIPIRMASWDDGKYGADKAAGKSIKSIDEYQQFSYPY
jgi:hypothetical protein